MTENQPESSPNENLVDDTPISPELLEKNSSLEQESAPNPNDYTLRNKATDNKQKIPKDKEASEHNSVQRE